MPITTQQFVQHCFPGALVGIHGDTHTWRISVRVTIGDTCDWVVIGAGANADEAWLDAERRIKNSARQRYSV